jgi:hypothetical protein
MVERRSGRRSKTRKEGSMSDQLRNAKIVEEFAEGVHQSQREKTGTAV